MKKKKWLIGSLVAIVCISITVSAICTINNKRSINNLISQLENAINKHDIEKIIDLYPNYCKSDVIKYFSQEKLNEFYNNVIINDSEKMKVKILNISNFDTASCDDIIEQITVDYQENVIIEDYQLVTIKYHEAFSESNLQVIKIDGNYFLYFHGNIGEPLSYFH